MSTQFISNLLNIFKWKVDKFIPIILNIYAYVASEVLLSNIK